MPSQVMAWARTPNDGWNRNDHSTPAITGATA